MEVLHNHEDIDALSPFNPWEWIGVGKKYVQSEIPLQVYFQMWQQLIILYAHLAHFPAIDLQVIKFIEPQLPVQSTEIITRQQKHGSAKKPLILMWPVFSPGQSQMVNFKVAMKLSRKWGNSKKDLDESLADGKD